MHTQEVNFISKIIIEKNFWEFLSESSLEFTFKINVRIYGLLPTLSDKTETFLYLSLKVSSFNRIYLLFSLFLLKDIFYVFLFFQLVFLSWCHQRRSRHPIKVFFECLSMYKKSFTFFRLFIMKWFRKISKQHRLSNQLQRSTSSYLSFYLHRNVLPKVFLRLQCSTVRLGWG